MKTDTQLLAEFTPTVTLKEIRDKIEPDMQCVCDLDRWEPEQDTGHSHVCPIHRRMKSLWRQARRLGA